MSRKKTVLLIEDDDFKQNEIAEVLISVWSDCLLVCVGSVRAAIAEVASTSFDCILLDIALPSHDLLRGSGGSVSMPSGGAEVLMELSFLERTDKVIIITQYPSIEFDGKVIPVTKFLNFCNSRLNTCLISVIRFSKNDSAWKRRLSSALEQVND